MSKSKDQKVEVKNQDEIKNNPENETKDEVKSDTDFIKNVENPQVPQGEEKPAEKPEEDKTQKILDNVVKNEEETEKKAKTKDEIGTINGTPVYQKSAFIKTEQYKTPVPMYRIPEDIRQYLRNMGFGTNVWKESKEWLEKHGADMKMIERLKKFISENFN